MIEGALDLAARTPSAGGDDGLSDGKSIGYLRISPIHTIERYEVAHFVAYDDAHNHVELPRLCDCGIHVEFASASVTTCSVNASTNNRKEPSASQVPRQLHKLAALLRACLVPILRRHARNCRQRRGFRSRAGLGAGHVMDVAGRDQKADRAAFRIDPRVDLGEASSALAHTTIST